MLTVALAAFLAFEAWDAAHRHRVTAERAMTDYAKFAAWEFSASAKEQLYSTLVWAFSPTGTIDARDLDGPLPGPSILDHEKSSHLLCARDSSRYFFRLDMRDGSFVTSGDEPATSMRRWMLDTLPRNAKTYKSDWVYEVVSGSVDGHSRSIVYQLKRDRAGRPAVAYGFEFCFAQFAVDGLKKVMRHYAILPPSLTGGVPNDSVPNDSIFSARVFDGNGHLIFQSEVQYPPTYVGRVQDRLLRRPEERHCAAPDAGEDAAHRRAAERAAPAAARRAGAERRARGHWRHAAAPRERAGAAAVGLHRQRVARAADAARPGPHVRRDAAARARAKR